MEQPTRDFRARQGRHATLTLFLLRVGGCDAWLWMWSAWPVEDGEVTSGWLVGMMDGSHKTGQSGRTNIGYELVHELVHGEFAEFAG